MSLFDFLRLIYRNKKLLFTVPMILAGAVFIFTINQSKEFQSNALIYTGIASGYNIESGANAKMDYKEINAAYDNLMSVIKSRLTLEEVGLRLLALNLCQEKPGVILGPAAFEKLREIIPMSSRENYVIDNDPEKTYNNIRTLYLNGDPTLLQLIRGKSSYSIEKLHTIDIKRVKSSDMLSLEYITYDPGLCKQTLDILLKVFSSRYSQLKEAETGDVVAYYDAELRKAKQKLSTAEDELTAFMVNSRIINYGEETKALAIKKQNALEEYSTKKMNLRATEAALLELEKKMDMRTRILANNADLVSKKSELERLTSDISRLQAANINDSTFAAKLISQERLRSDIARAMTTNVTQTSTKEGVPGTQLVMEWLNHIIQYNREKVMVELFRKRLEDLDRQYDVYTPMGSNIDRLERQISVHEREYLEALHALNQSKLRQQNLEMTGQLEVLDRPAYPLDPLPSKRLLLIAMGLIVGFMGVMVALVATDLLDHSLRHPEKARNITGLDIAGAFPVLEENFEKKYGDLMERVTGILASKMMLEKHTINEEEDATMIVGISTQTGEGKTHTLKRLFEEMTEAGEKVCYIAPEGTQPKKKHFYPYQVHDKFSSAKTIGHIFAHRYNYILMELPAWVEGKTPVHIIEHAQVILWTIRADRVWSTAHKQMQEDLARIANVKPSLVLNGVKPYYLDQVVAEVPVHRSAFARWIRRIVRFQFGDSGIKNIKNDKK